MKKHQRDSANRIRAQGEPQTRHGRGAPALRQRVTDASLYGIVEFPRPEEKIARHYFNTLYTSRFGLSNERAKAVRRNQNHHQDRLLQEPRQPHCPPRHAQMRLPRPSATRTPIPGDRADNTHPHKHLKGLIDHDRIG